MRVRSTCCLAVMVLVCCAGSCLGTSRPIGNGIHCSINKTQYISSTLELRSYQKANLWSTDYCSAYRNTSHGRTAYQAGVQSVNAALNNQLHQLTAATAGAAAPTPEVLSAFKYDVICGAHVNTAHEAIEPLFGILRNPESFDCSGTEPKWVDKQGMDVSYLVLETARGVRLKLAPQKIVVDLGASVYRELSQSWMVRTYEARGINFDRHLMWEARPMPDSEIFQGVPPSDYHNFQYFNIPASADPNDPTNPLNIIKKIAKPEDFVVLKLDIDNSQLEASFLQQIMTDPDIFGRIDELFWEPHFNLPPLIRCCWGGSADTSLTPQMVYDKLIALRRLGIRAHGWP